MWCMFRTNIYLDEDQVRALDQAARAQGLSRASLIRRLIDRGMDVGDGNLEADLAAIEATFNLSNDDAFVVRGDDARARHLERIRTSDDPR